MDRTFVTLGLAVVTIAAVAGLQAQQPWVGTGVQQQAFGRPGNGKLPALVQQFVGSGRWQSQRGNKPSSDRAAGSSGASSLAASGTAWQVQLKHLDDDSLAGRVLIVGSPVLDHARILGQVTGRDVDGALLDDGGRQVGTFSGTIRNNRLSGSYTTADGDAGTWGWDGALPGGLDD
jgi:hypothetical protein